MFWEGEGEGGFGERMVGKVAVCFRCGKIFP